MHLPLHKTYASQKKQELEEKVLGHQMALAAQSEQNYDSDGSDDYREPADKPSAMVDLAMPTTKTPVIGPLPWSWRSASYPHWSQGGASTGTRNSRAASLPLWSQVERRSSEETEGGTKGE